ncbi:transmembrane protein 272-like isoform X2 [Ornithodoros turicata]|uniref:transmembrane protein 272-like isoform X2 n=1 Tax=Ornithodoros turicata TaxID=34597 RepID=UPI003138D1A8
MRSQEATIQKSMSPLSQPSYAVQCQGYKENDTDIVIVLILSLVLGALQIAGIVIGALHLNDCPVQRFIPIFLVTGGSIGIVNVILGGYKRHRSSRDDESSSSTGLTCCSYIIQCFLLGWFIAGCVWVYGSYLPNFDDPANPKYCDKTLYYFAFSTLTAWLVISGVFIVYSCSMIIYVTFMKD